MKILITGGAGFLGINLGREALNRGHDLFIFDNLLRKGAKQNIEWLESKGKFIFKEGSIELFKEIDNFISKIKPEAIFHLAGQVAMTTSIENPIKDFNINALGSLNLLESARKHLEKTPIIYSSTNKVYGDLEEFKYIKSDKRYVCIEHEDGFNEQIPLNFHSPYGCSKGSADQYMLDYFRIFDLSTVVFRHSSMYGGRQFSTHDQGWVGWFCDQAIKIRDKKIKNTISISGNGFQVRDLLHSQDVVDLYFLALEEIDSIKGEAFNIGGGLDNSLSLLELFDYLNQKLDIELKINRQDTRESDQKVFIADLTKIKSKIDWIPKISLNEGLDNQIEWQEQKN